MKATVIISDKAALRTMQMIKGHGHNIRQSVQHSSVVQATVKGYMKP